MNACVVYHWWPHEADQPPRRNQRTPLGASIATLRACNPDVPVVVLQMEGDADWGDLPDLLGFRVIRREFSIKSREAGWRILSRFDDVLSFADESEFETIVYADADTFWLDGPFPLSCDPSRFCFNGYNNGFYYFNKSSPEAREFFDVYRAFLTTALYDENFRIVSRQYTRHADDFFVFDEAITAYISKKLPRLFYRTPTHDHMLGDTLLGGPELRDLDLSTVRMIHAHGIRVRDPFRIGDPNHSRGLVCLLIRPLLERIIRTCGLDALYDISHQRLAHFAVPLDRDFLGRLMDAKDPDGRYNLLRAVGVPSEYSLL